MNKGRLGLLLCNTGHLPVGNGGTVIIQRMLGKQCVFFSEGKQVFTLSLTPVCFELIWILDK